MNDLPLRVKRRWTEEEGVSGSAAGWRIAQSVKHLLYKGKVINLYLNTLWLYLG